MQPSAAVGAVPRLPPMLLDLATADHTQTSGFNVTNVIVLVVVLAVLVPAVNRLRRGASERRRARWAEEERQRQQRPEDPGLDA